MSVNEKIRLVRESKGLTQEEVADKLQMSGNGYGDIERGETDIKLSRLFQLAELFDMKPADFFEPNEKTNINVRVRQNKGGFCINSSKETETLKFMLEQKDKEIGYLKEIIELMKGKTATPSN